MRRPSYAKSTPLWAAAVALALVAVSACSNSSNNGAAGNGSS